MSNIITIKNVRAYLDESGTAQINLEDAARGLGFTRVAASGNEVVRWERVMDYLKELGFSVMPTSGHVENYPEFIPENIFYRLAMKAKNETAEKFQALVADEILPSIRKTGGYVSEQPKLTQIQMLAAMAQQMADQEQMMLAASANASTALRQIDFIRETIVRRDDDNWRANINLDLNAIVKASGKTYQDVRNESYDLLDSRGGCRLSVRVANARERLREAGAKKPVIEKFCKLDAVEEDSKLREIYSNIVKEMAIRDMGGATCRI